MDNRQQVDKQLAEIGESSSTKANVKSITNICYDCLERIFEFLDLESLLNVANTCKRLQIAAAAYYGDVHGKHRVIFWPQIRYRRIGIRHDGIIYVDAVKCCLQFLRCFGPKILDLDAFYDNRANDDNTYVNRYINQYCAKTLERISINNYPEISIANYPNPFECVKEVSMMSVSLKWQFTHLVNLFPKLRILNMSHVSVDGICTDVHFPNLERLAIRFGRPRGFTRKNAVDLLHANPQLQKLRIGMTYDQEITVNELLDIISQNPSITRLKLWNKSDINIGPVDLMRFASERPHTVELELPRHRISPQDAINFIRQLKSLKIFRFLFNDQADYDQLVSQLDIKWQHKINFGNNNINIITLKR